MSGSARPTSADDVRLAVLTVPFVRDAGDERLLALQLTRITQHTTVPVTIHVDTRNVTPAAMTALVAHPAVVIHAVAGDADPGSRQHARILDGLLDAARTTDATHFATFDMDSFPIADDWLERALAEAGDAPVAAVLRVENGDTHLPHPSCTVLTREFVDTHAVSFSPDSDGTREFRAFLHSTRQAGDTGIRIGFTLWAEGRRWATLERSNRIDLHPLIAGIYGDIVFHLGAGTRAALFRHDVSRAWAFRLTSPIERIPVGAGRIRAAKKAVIARIRRPSEARLIAANEDAGRRAREWLLRDADGLFAHLRGESSAPGPQAHDKPPPVNPPGGD